jgi:SOS-response transcriptional repressor LexA
MLNQRQKELLESISNYIAVHSYAPMVKEMAAALDGVGNGNLQFMLLRLQADGYISRVKHDPRATKVLKPAEAK